jgi:hypothetical protein
MSSGLCTCFALAYNPARASYLRVVMHVLRLSVVMHVIRLSVVMHVLRLSVVMHVRGACL